MQDELLDILLKKDDISWQSLIYELVKSEKMDPWNVDISILAQKYIEMVKKMTEMDFFVSGKVVLASAILLKMKSNKLLHENIASFDSNLFDSNEITEETYEPLEEYSQERLTNPKLTIRTPQSRKKKVSIIDLVNALEKALEVEHRRKERYLRYDYVPENLKIPDKKIDISKRIKDVYAKITEFFSTKKENLKFSNLIPENASKQDIIGTFVPVLHLDNQNKVEIFQPNHFEDFNIQLKKEVKNEGT